MPSPTLLPRTDFDLYQAILDKDPDALRAAIVKSKSGRMPSYIPSPHGSQSSSHLLMKHFSQPVVNAAMDGGLKKKAFSPKMAFAHFPEQALLWLASQNIDGVGDFPPRFVCEYLHDAQRAGYFRQSADPGGFAFLLKRTLPEMTHYFEKGGRMGLALTALHMGLDDLFEEAMSALAKNWRPAARIITTNLGDFDEADYQRLRKALTRPTALRAWQTTLSRSQVVDPEYFCNVGINDRLLLLLIRGRAPVIETLIAKDDKDIVRLLSDKTLSTVYLQGNRQSAVLELLNMLHRHPPSWNVVEIVLSKTNGRSVGLFKTLLKLFPNDFDQAAPTVMQHLEAADAAKLSSLVLKSNTPAPKSTPAASPRSVL